MIDWSVPQLTLLTLSCRNETTKAGRPTFQTTSHTTTDAHDCQAWKESRVKTFLNQDRKHEKGAEQVHCSKLAPTELLF